MWDTITDWYGFLGWLFVFGVWIALFVGGIWWMVRVGRRVYREVNTHVTMDPDRAVEHLADRERRRFAHLPPPPEGVVYREE